MDRARKMVVLDEDEPNTTPRFKMERNGNLIPATNPLLEDTDAIL